MKTIALSLVLMAAIFGGTFAAWKYGAVDSVVGAVRRTAGKILDRGAGEPAPTAISATLTLEEPDSTASSATQPSQTPAGLRPPASLRPFPEASRANPAPAAMAEQDASRPIPMEAIASAAPAPQAPAQSREPRGTAQPGRRQAGEEEQSASGNAPGPGMAPTPVLSDAKAQIRFIDQILNTDPSGAMRRLTELSQTRLEPAEAAEVEYRLGYAARMLRDEALAEKSWQEAVEKHPETRGGRFSALALADTWFQQYAAGARPQVSYWDDIQLMYSRVLGRDDAPFLPEAKKDEVKTRLNRLNDSIFFGTAPSKLARYYKVEQGELLGGIAQKHRVDYESIARINGINPNRIRAGMDLKLIVGDVEVVVRKNANVPGKHPTLTWFMDGRWVREYPTCVGDGAKTPSGSYSFTSKERDPSWTNPANGQLLPNEHPENILGSRWMAMKGMNTQGLGIHGTTVDDSIPGYTSAGCVRLLNRDVEELFSYARIGGRVTILD